MIKSLTKSSHLKHSLNILKHITFNIIIEVLQLCWSC